jgi:hypothetical protein
MSFSAGVDWRDCFIGDSDRLVYLSSLRQLLTHKHCPLHAYCLMTNHGEDLKARLGATVCRALERAKPGPRVIVGKEPESLELDF